MIITFFFCASSSRANFIVVTVFPLDGLPHTQNILLVTNDHPLPVGEEYLYPRFFFALRFGAFRCIFRFIRFFGFRCFRRFGVIFGREQIIGLYLQKFIAVFFGAAVYKGAMDSAGSFKFGEDDRLFGNDKQGDGEGSCFSSSLSVFSVYDLS
jgi:hypothetical protein